MRLLAALLASSVVLGGITVPREGRAQPAATQGVRQFNIPAQPLTDALVQFGYQSGLQVAADGSVAASVRSNAVSGSFTPAEALGRMLAGTGLTFQFTGATTIQVVRLTTGDPGAMQLDPVQVQGFPVPPQAMIDNLPPPYAGGQVATGGQLGLMGNRGVMDTPFNQTSYTSKKIQDQQAQTVFEALADDPSVRITKSDLTQNGTNVMIRGFSVSPSSTLFGGLYGMLPYYSINSEIAERVEVLKGPSIMLNGMTADGSLGGIINVVPKRAPEQTLAEFTASYMSNAQFGGHADIAHRFGADKQYGVRFNGVFRDGNTPIDWTTDKRALVTLGLDFRGERVRLATDLGYQNQYIGAALPELGLAVGVPVPWAPDARKNQGSPWGFIDRKDAWAIVRGEVDIVDGVTFYAAAGARDNRDQYMLTRNLTVSSFNGAATAFTGNLNFYFQNLTATAGVRGIVDTGPINHEFAFGATTVSQTFGVGIAPGAPSYTTNIYAPSYINSPNLVTPQANLSSTTVLNSLAIADTLSASNKRVQLTVGARLQQIQAANYNTTTGAMTSYYDQSKLSPAVALVIKPWWENVSFYANYVQALQQGAVVPANFANAGEVFPPYTTTQYEAGVKVDWGKLTTTLSLFQITRPSLISNVATNTQILNGQQVNQGLELNVFGEVAPGVRVLGGAMFLNALLTQTAGGATNGWTAPFTPGAQFNLAGEWDLPFARGLTLTGRVTYTGPQYIDTTLPRRSLSEWTRLDAGFNYMVDNLSPTGKPVVVRFSVENLLDNDYWLGGTSASVLTLGAPRTFRLALTAAF